jgi:hypothetical protein
MARARFAPPLTLMPILIDAELARGLQRHHRERLVDLPQVDVLDLHAGLLERLLDAGPAPSA